MKKPRKPPHKSHRGTQLNLLPKDARDFGGRPRTTRRSRGARPLSTKQSIHLILRSTKATGARSLLKYRHEIRAIIKKQAAKARIQLINRANAGNHLHLHIKLPNDVLHRVEYRRFIRAVSGLVARQALKAQRGAAKLARGERFWDLRPFTRVLSSWREFLSLKDYVNMNHLESLGFERALAREMIRPSILVESG